MRAKFAEELNVALPPPVPGGWSAWDQVHGFFKKLNDDSTRAELGFKTDLFARASYYQLELGCSGQVRRSISLEESDLVAKGHGRFLFCLRRL